MTNTLFFLGGMLAGALACLAIICGLVITIVGYWRDFAIALNEIDKHESTPTVKIVKTSHIPNQLRVIQRAWYGVN